MTMTDTDTELGNHLWAHYPDTIPNLRGTSDPDHLTDEINTIARALKERELTTVDITATRTTTGGIIVSIPIPHSNLSITNHDATTSLNEKIPQDARGRNVAVGIARWLLATVEEATSTVPALPRRRMW